MVGNWMDRRSFPGEERGCANPLVEFFFFFFFFFFCLFFFPSKLYGTVSCLIKFVIGSLKFSASTRFDCCTVF